MIINDIGMTLREFLGLTPYEYQKWGGNSDSIIKDGLTLKRKVYLYRAKKMLKKC